MNRLPHLAFFVFATAALAFGQSQIRLTYIQGDSLAYIGFAVLKEIYAQLGVQVERMELPAERALRTSNAGEADGEILRIDGLEKTYPNLVKVPAPVLSMEGSAFAKKPSVRVSGWDSLKAYKVGIQKGIKFAENGTAGMSPYLFSDAPTMFQRLELGDIDVAIDAKISGLVELGRLGYTDIRSLEPPLITMPMYHYLHVSQARLVPLVAARIEELRKSGELKKMIERALEALMQKK